VTVRSGGYSAISTARRRTSTQSHNRQSAAARANSRLLPHCGIPPGVPQDVRAPGHQHEWMKPGESCKVATGMHRACVEKIGPHAIKDFL
jgi:hypothetical protein